MLIAKRGGKAEDPYPIVLGDWHGSKQASDDVLPFFSELAGDGTPPRLSGGYEGQSEVVGSGQFSPTRRMSLRSSGTTRQRASSS
jgi:hypothetical protein